MQIKLYEFGPTRSARVRWTLLELELPFESVEDRALFGSAELRTISPLGKIPAIVVDGRAMVKSAAICTWLADSVPEKALIPEVGSWQRAMHEQWTSFCLAELEAHLWSSARNSFVYPEAPHLASHAFLLGERFQVTNIIMGFALNWARREGWMDGFEHCGRYVTQLLEMPRCPYR